MVVSFAPLRARVYMIGTFEKTRNSCRSLGHRSSAGDRRLHNPQLVLRFPASQEAHVGNASSSSSPRSTTTCTPLSTEYGTNWAKSRTLATLNVSSSRFPSSLQNSFAANRAITMSVSAQSFTYEKRLSGFTLSWITKVIRDKTTGEVKRELIMLGGL